MNILPKKRWHVRTKENVARVRRDQKQAEEMKTANLNRALISEREFKLNILRRNANERKQSVFGTEYKDKSDIAIEDRTGHVNLFVDVEETERKNLVTGNKEYEEEKRKNKEDYEKKIGILQFVGQGSNELTKKSAWYEQFPIHHLQNVPKKPTKPTKRKNILSSRNYNRKLQKEWEKKSGKKKHHKYNKGKRCSKKHDILDEIDEENAKKKKLEELRMERLKREEIERRKATELMTTPSASSMVAIVPRYNTQFNPDLARQNRI